LIWSCCGDWQRRTYWGMLGENFHFALFEQHYASFEIFTVVWLRIRSFWHMTLHFCLCCHSAHFDWIKLFSHVKLRHFWCCEGALYIYLKGFWETTFEGEGKLFLGMLGTTCPVSYPRRTALLVAACGWFWTLAL
jgi:hypothetical protein